MGRTFNLIAIQKRIIRPSLNNRRELPSKVKCIPNAHTHALTHKRRRKMRRIAGNQQPPFAPCMCYSRPEGIYSTALKCGIVRRDPAR